jgi:hypothetical protein
LSRDRTELAVQLDPGLLVAVKDNVNLGVILMVVLAGVTTDLGQVNGTGKFFTIAKSSPSRAAGAIDGRQGGQIDDGWFGWHAIVSGLGLLVRPAAGGDATDPPEGGANGSVSTPNRTDLCQIWDPNRRPGG